MDISTLKAEVVHLNYKKEKNSCQNLHYTHLQQLISEDLVLIYHRKLSGF